MKSLPGEMREEKTEIGVYVWIRLDAVRRIMPISDASKASLL